MQRKGNSRALLGILLTLDQAGSSEEAYKNLDLCQRCYMSSCHEQVLYRQRRDLFQRTQKIEGTQNIR